MVPKSNQKAQAEAAIALGRAYQALQEAGDAFDEAAAAVLGVNRTDMRLLSVLDRVGPQPTGALGAAVGLSKAAATAAIDRLVAARYAAREASETDRRRTVVRLTASAHERFAALWGPMVAEGATLAARFSAEELDVVRRYLDGALAVQEAHLARVRALGKG